MFLAVRSGHRSYYLFSYFRPVPGALGATPTRAQCLGLLVLVSVLGGRRDRDLLGRLSAEGAFRLYLVGIYVRGDFSVDFFPGVLDINMRSFEHLKTQSCYLWCVALDQYILVYGMLLPYSFRAITLTCSLPSFWLLLLLGALISSHTLFPWEVLLKVP